MRRITVPKSLLAYYQGDSRINYLWVNKFYIPMIEYNKIVMDLLVKLKR